MDLPKARFCTKKAVVPAYVGTNMFTLIIRYPRYSGEISNRYKHVIPTSSPPRPDLPLRGI